MLWKPKVTVAAIIERGGRFLLVEEDTDETRHESARHRSPLVMRCIEDYLAGRRYPLAVLRQHSNW